MKEHEIFRAQHLELIYSQSGILYEIMPNEELLNIDLQKLKSRPHVDGIVGSSQIKFTDLVYDHMKQLSIQ